MHIINSPVGLYYNGELIGVVTNPDPVPGGIGGICGRISPRRIFLNRRRWTPGSLCDTRPLDDPCDHIASAVESLPESIPVDTEDECA